MTTRDEALFHDPVVQEMRDNFAKIAEECGNDLDRLVERFRREQAAHADRLVNRPREARAKLGETDSRTSSPR